MAWRLTTQRFIVGALALGSMSIPCGALGASGAAASRDGRSPPTDPVLPVDHAASVVAIDGQPIQLGRASRSSDPGRLVLIGDSIAAGLCQELPTASCFAFPGAWVADVKGDNLVDQFVTAAALGPNDSVVLSSIGGWHSPGVDDAVILARLDALYQRIARVVHRVVVLVAPYPNFKLCTDPSTPEAVALLGARHDELCATQQAIADLERSWPATTIPIIGPYVADEEHETSGARSELARAIVYVL